ncbi:hypothetical protein [Nocardia tengchongensis]|uniref:hypothetical protein n=1 Tax=Nocardia tengchongensis TaxID=2055889 RepID=UPI0036A5FA8B
MMFNGFSRQLTALSVLGDSARRMKARHTLTAEERHNMAVSRGRGAIHTAALGGHSHR